MPSKDASDLSSVSLTTWGTDPDGGNGLSHFLDARFFGGNVGHASVAVTFPAGPEGDELIKKYCYKEARRVLPFVRKSQRTLDENNQVIHQDVYIVYFSWWPGVLGYSLKPNINADNVLERPGADVGKYTPYFTEPGDPHALVQEQRPYRGILGSKVMTLSPQQVAHVTPLDENQRLLLELERRSEEIDQNIEALSILDKKLSSKTKSISIKGTILILLNAHIENWREKVKNPGKISNEEIERLKKMVNDKNELYHNEKDAINKQKENILEKYKVQRQEKLNIEINKLHIFLSSLPEDARDQLLQRKGSPFSVLAWTAYEQQQVQKTLTTIEQLKILFKHNDFDSHKGKEIILNALFDDIYPDTINEEGRITLRQWKDVFPQFKKLKREEISRENFTKAFDYTNEQLQKRNQELLVEIDMVTSEDPFLQSGYERYVTRGHKPDEKITLPVGGITGKNIKPGLNVENMLKKMRDLTEQPQGFDLNTNNCSVTVGAILAAGAEAEQRSFFNRGALGGGFGTPQEVRNGALEYQEAIVTRNGKKSRAQWLNEHNPLNVIAWLGGKVLKSIAQPKTPFLVKAALVLIILPPITVLAVFVETVNAIANPKKTFINCAKFINYAWKNNSIFLKICTAPVAVVAIIAAIPAGIQHGIGTWIIAPIANLFKPKIKKEISPHDTLQRDLLKLDKDKIVEVNTLNPQEAIDKLETLLQEKPQIVPILSAQTQAKVDSYLKSLDRNNPVAQKYQVLIKKVFKRTNEIIPTQNYQHYVARIKLVQPHFGATLDHVIVSYDEYHRHPNLYGNYAIQLKMDMRHGNEPTSFAHFKVAHQRAKAQTGKKRPKLSEYKLQHKKWDDAPTAEEVAKPLKAPDPNSG